MRIDGDIKVWIDGDTACARIAVDGPEGPMVVRASAPLAPIRRDVERMFSRRGVDVSGDDTAFKATVKRLGRKKALRRLQKLAPAAFQRGGLAPYLAREELKKRGRQRLALAAAGTPVGSKAIGRLAASRSRARRLARRMRAASLARARARRGSGLLPALPGLAARAPSAGQPPLPALGPSSPGGGELAPGAETSLTERGSGAGPAAANALDEQRDFDPAAPADGTEDVSEEATHEASDTDDQVRDIDEEQEQEEEGMHANEGDGVSGDRSLVLARRRARARAHIRAATRLLHAARHDPSARKRVRTIVSLAGEGDPKAVKAAKALAVANRMRKQSLTTGLAAPPRALPPKAASPGRPALPPVPKSAPAAAMARKPQGKWWDVLAPWRRGIG